LGNASQIDYSKIDVCNLPAYWTVQKGRDGKCYNVCEAGQMMFEIEPQYCEQITGSMETGYPGNLTQTQILVFALGAVLLFAVMTR
jgi:hypothetical protein